MAVNSYPSVLLLDDLNNPISPMVDIDSIYRNESGNDKEFLNVLCEIKDSKIENKEKILVDTSTGNISIEDPEFGERGTVTILTDVKMEEPADDGSGKMYPVHTLKLQRVDLNTLLTTWYEEQYMRNQLGFEIWYGNHKSKPISFDVANREVVFVDMRQKLNENFKHQVDGVDVPNHMYRINDYNSTNFLSTDDSQFPRRGKVYPSNEYIWFIILTANGAQLPIENTVKLFGASGDDSPQEIEISRIGNSGYWLFCSKSTFGIDEEFNMNDGFNDGFEYNIYVKYKQNK